MSVGARGAGRRWVAGSPSLSEFRFRYAEGATPDEIRRVLVEVEQEMMTAAEELRFERAAELRDRLAVLRAELGEDAVVAGAEG